MVVATRTSLEIKREFLGWDAPALPLAARRLAQRYSKERTLDLNQVIVVVPGQRAGRRLLELLAFLAEDENLLLTPPTVVTQGRLPELLYTPKLPFAEDVVQDLAWAQALRDLPAKQRDFVLPHLPTDALGWLDLGKVFRRLHVELAADGLDFEAVRKAGPRIAGFAEAERWSALVALQRRYHDLLDKQRLWDRQTARLKAVEFREIQTDRDIILLGTVDLNNTHRAMLAQIAERVTAYIVAPEEKTDHFDSFGCLRPAAWREEQVPLDDDQLQQVDGPEDQADAVSEWLAKVAARFHSDEIAIGVPDESLVPQLQRQLAQCEVKPRWVEGVRIAETSPYRLLRAAADFAAGRRYDDLAALLRHPEVESWLSRSSTLVAQLDAFYNSRLASRIGDIPSDDKDWPDLPRAVKTITRWLASAQHAKPLRAWGDIFAKILSTVFGSKILDLAEPGDDALHSTICKMLEECDRLTAIPTALDSEPLSAKEAFKVAFGPLGDTFLPPPPNSEAVEILGWLELPLDDSKAVIVTSFNEGFVPKSAGADAFLPDRLRKEMQLMDNERRYARDAYATGVLCHGRDLQVLLARRDVNKEPLQPSRLVFACDETTAIRRAQRFFGERESTPRRTRSVVMTSSPLEKSLFAIPKPETLSKAFDRISVTRFKEYIACPYRFYLKRIKKLEPVDDSAREWDGAIFGSLLHQVLSTFGRDASGPRDSDKPKRIFDYLVDQLDRAVCKGAGAGSPCHDRPAIRLQIEQARRRLRAFAEYQARLIAEGWRIVFAEDETDELMSAPFPVDGEPIMLLGRIDRIDYHEGKDIIRVVDYKTAATAKKPESTHRKSEEWIDLQLPLYRHLWPKAPLKRLTCRAIELGYFNLPKRTQDTRVEVATWDEAMLEGADDKARDVIRKIREGLFWKPNPPSEYDDFAAICMTKMVNGPQLTEEILES